MEDYREGAFRRACELVRRVRRGDSVKASGPVAGFCGVTWEDVRANPWCVTLPEDGIIPELDARARIAKAQADAKAGR